MADPIADNADFAVDELKRKARRRLVGAIVIALAAATILPLLLEQEQKPLGDDVSVEIPPVDSGKFVSRLKGDANKGAAPDVKPDSGAIRAAPESGSAVPGPVPATPEVKLEPKVAAAPADAPPSPASPPSPPADTAPTPAPPASAPASEPSRTEGYVVQLGAFTDNYGANALANKLKKSGYPAFTESVETSRGTLWRVRVGGYPTRQAAVAARNKLKADGHNGVVTAVK